MVEISIDQTPANADSFLIRRAISIERYAQVEQALSGLFAQLLGSSEQMAAIVFFWITNAKSRNVIIEQLLAARHGETYEHYWNGIPNTQNKKGLFTILRQLDSRRNEIVHWHTVHNVRMEDEVQSSTLTLMRPNFWTQTSEKVAISEDDLQAFSAKADFAARSINMFTLMTGTNPHITADAQNASRDIFRQPCVYPPAEGHPIYPTGSKP